MENEVRIEARPWEPQDLIDDLQLMIDEEPDSYLNGSIKTLCMARDYLKKFFAEESLRPKGRWVWFEEWLPSTTEHPRECLDCGWRCGECKNALEDMVGGYWDNPDEKPELNYCPNCGADMRGEVDDK